MVRISLSFFLHNNICSESINLNVSLLVHLFCKIITKDQTSHYRTLTCNFVYEVQFFTARRNLKSRGCFFYYNLLLSAQISFLLWLFYLPFLCFAFWLSSFPDICLRCVCLVGRSENKHKNVYVWRVFCGFYFLLFIFLYCLRFISTRKNEKVIILVTKKLVLTC